MPETAVAENPQAPMVVRQETPSVNETTPPSPTTPETPRMPSVAEFRAGGEKEEKLAIDEQTRKNVRDRLEERIRIARFLEKEERPLSQIDRLLLRLGDRVTANLESGNLTNQDAAVSYFALYDEAIQKFLASGKVAATEVGYESQKKGWGPWSREIQQPVVTQKTTALEQRLSSEYTRKLGFETWSEARIDTELKSLTNLIHTVESSLLGLSPNDTFLDERLSTTAPFMLEGKTGNFLRDEVFDQLMGPEGILTKRHNGKTFLELWNEDPVTALDAFNEANQRALTTFADQTAKELLSKEKPKANTDLIEQQAKKLEQPPEPEDIAPLRQAETETKTAFENAQKSFNDLKTRLETANQELPTKQLAFDGLQAYFNKAEPDLRQQINDAQDNYIDIYNRLITPPQELSPQEQSQHNQNIAAQLTELTKDISAKQSELRQLLRELAFAEAALNHQNNLINSLEAQVQTAQGDLDAKKVAKEAAEKELKEKQEVIIPEENKEKAKDLREWIKVVNGYEKIIELRFSQKLGDEYTRERLADVTIRPDGQIEGAERIREHISRLVNPLEYDPELARKMLSDETIARAIAWTYKIDLSQIKTEEGSISIQKALLYLRSSQFQTGDLLRFIVHEGVKSAERGNPYLTLDKYFEAPQPDLRLEAESIYREGVGEIKEMKDNTMVWEGTIINPIVPNGFDRISPLYCSTGFEFFPDSVNYNLYVKVDRGLLESLPTEINDSLPEEVKSFYDESGKLRTDRPITRIKFYESSPDTPPNTTDEALNALDGQVSNELSQGLTVSIGDYFLKKSQAERLQMLRGFQTVDIPNVALAENPDELHSYQIRLDNAGNFLITDVSDPTSLKEYELRHFFQKRLEEFRGSKNVLTPNERKTLQEQLLKILSPLGREILRTQQRR